MKIWKVSLIKTGKILVSIPLYIFFILEGAITGKNDPWEKMLKWINQ